MKQTKAKVDATTIRRMRALSAEVLQLRRKIRDLQVDDEGFKGLVYKVGLLLSVCRAHIFFFFFSPCRYASLLACFRIPSFASLTVLYTLLERFAFRCLVGEGFGT